MSKDKVVKITFESNDRPGKKAVLEITNDVKLKITFEPNVHRDETADYAAYLSAFMKLLTNE